MTTATTKGGTMAHQAKVGLASIEEAGAYLALKRSSIYKLIDAGALQRASLPGISAVRITWASIEALAAVAE